MTPRTAKIPAPTLLNETSEGEPRVVLTQNAPADVRYLDYLDFLYADPFTTLTSGDSRCAFQDAKMASAQTNPLLVHDYTAEAE